MRILLRWTAAGAAFLAPCAGAAAQYSMPALLAPYMVGADPAPDAGPGKTTGQPAIADGAVLATLRVPSQDNPSVLETYRLYGADVNGGLASRAVRTLCNDDSCIRNLDRDLQGQAGWWAVVRRGRTDPPHFASAHTMVRIPDGFTPAAEGGQLVARQGSPADGRTQVIRFDAGENPVHSTALFTFSRGERPQLESAVLSGPGTLADLLGQERLAGVQAAMQGASITIEGRDGPVNLHAAVQEFLRGPGRMARLHFEPGGVAQLRLLEKVEGRERELGFVDFRLSGSPQTAVVSEDSTLPRGWTRRTGE